MSFRIEIRNGDENVSVIFAPSFVNSSSKFYDLRFYALITVFTYPQSSINRVFFPYKTICAVLDIKHCNKLVHERPSLRC